MFDKGAYVVHQSAGVCEVMDIDTLNLDGADKSKLYYFLRPCAQKNSKIFTPVNNEKTVIRSVLSGKEAAALLDDIPDIEELWITNEKMRESAYREAIKSCDCREWIRVIKTLYVRKQERLAQGKKISSIDEKYLYLAEENLYSELSLTTGVPKDKMEEYITLRVGIPEQA